MNAINHTEAQAIHATGAPAIPLEAADPHQEPDSCPAVAAGVAPQGSQRAQTRACPFRNWPPASSVSACCKT